jgi:hypothetical protein
MGEVGLVGTNSDLGGTQDRRRVGLARVNVTSGQLALRCRVVMPPCELDMMIEWAVSRRDWIQMLYCTALRWGDI